MVVPGGKRRRHKERHYECKERDLLVLVVCQYASNAARRSNYVHRLKLVTGVEISTRPVRRSGKEGNARKRTRRTAAAKPKSSAFCRSIAIGHANQVTASWETCWLVEGQLMDVDANEGRCREP